MNPANPVNVTINSKIPTTNIIIVAVGAPNIHPAITRVISFPSYSKNGSTGTLNTKDIIKDMTININISLILLFFNKSPQKY